MSPPRRLRAVALALAALLATCDDAIDPEGHSCPCTAGHVCCGDVCVRADRCPPDAGLPDAGPPDAEAAAADADAADDVPFVAPDVPVHVGACDNLAVAGVWQDITPPEVKALLPGPGACDAGTGAFVLHPAEAGTIYLGTCNMGVWKSTDCGATWKLLSTGSNGRQLGEGEQWTFAIDPLQPDVLYTNSGRGVSSNGAWKSTNGGVDWTALWPPDDATLAGVVEYNTVGTIALDPRDHRHLLLTFWGHCRGGHHEVCFAQSRDAGATWRIYDGRAEWATGQAAEAWFLDGGDTFLWGSSQNGVWRTTDGGLTFTAVTGPDVLGNGQHQLYRAHDRVYYLASTQGMLRSPDGIVWTTFRLPGGPMLGVTGDGTRLYASFGFPYPKSALPEPYAPFATSAESDGRTWTTLPSPKLTNGGSLAYDPQHRVLYSSNANAGFWRVVLP